MPEINAKRLLTNFLDLCAISSPSKREGRMAEKLKIILTDIGCTVWTDNAGEKLGGETGNLHAELAATAAGLPTLLFSAHMDTVGPCEKVTPILGEDGIIRTDGTSVLGGDDKSGVAAIIEALRVVQEENIPHGKLKVIFSVAEEIGDLGASCVSYEEALADAIYVLDDEGAPGSIVTSAPGKYGIIVRVHGKTAHGGCAPEKGINAVKAAADIISKLPSNRLDSETTCNIGYIKGGTAPNIVPDYAEFSCDLRSKNQEKLLALRDKFLDIIYHSSTIEGAKVEAEVEEGFKAFSLPQEHPAVCMAKEAALRQGLPVIITSTGGGSDANDYNAIGLAAVLLGTGMSEIHTCNEYLKAEDLYNSARLVLGIIEQSSEKKA